MQGIHGRERENRKSKQKKRKTHLTHTGLLMEGLRSSYFLRSTRSLLGSSWPRRENARKILLVPEKHNEPKYRHYNRQRQAFRVHQQVIGKDAHDHRPENRQSQWHITVDEQQHSTNDLRRADHVHEVRYEERS